jgi:hypothetical protein
VTDVPVYLAKDEAAYLAAFLGRVTGWDERSAVRVQVRGAVLGVYAPSPLDVLAFIALPLVAAADESIDRTVSAGRLRDILGDVSRLGPSTELVLPDEITGSPTLAVLPPTSPWSPGERGMAGDLTPRIDAAVAEFRASVPRSGSVHAELLAEATWDRPGWGGVPMRALHAARLLGFLTHPGARVETATVSGWKRLVTPAGQIFVRNTTGPVRLSLVPQAR